MRHSDQSSREHRLLRQNQQPGETPSPVEDSGSLTEHPGSLAERNLKRVESGLSPLGAREDAQELVEQEQQRRVEQNLVAQAQPVRAAVDAIVRPPETAVQKSIRELREHAESNPAGFHREITMTEQEARQGLVQVQRTVNGAERDISPWMRVHRSPRPGPKPLIIVFNGNGNPVINCLPPPAGRTRHAGGWRADTTLNPEQRRVLDAFPQGVERSATHLYERISTERPNDFNVIHLRVGDIINRNDLTMQPDYAAEVARLVISQALAGEGMFEGMETSEVRTMGNSHGAGLVSQRLSPQWADLMPRSRSATPVEELNEQDQRDLEAFRTAFEAVYATTTPQVPHIPSVAKALGPANAIFERMSESARRTAHRELQEYYHHTRYDFARQGNQLVPRSVYIPLTRTVSLDGINYGQVNGALTVPPAGTNHLHMYQPNATFAGMFLAGGPVPGNPRGVRNLRIDRGITGLINHRTINNGYNPGVRETVFNPMYEHLVGND